MKAVTVLFHYYSFFFVAVSLLTVVAARSPVLLKLKNDIEARNAEGIADPKLARTLLDNDFESGSANPWFDESPAYVNWGVEDVASPTERNSSVPPPSTGTKYMRATRNADLSSGLAVLRSPVFTASPGDRVSFDFWIRSKRPEGNNLELVWLVDRTGVTLVGLSQFSTLANFEWRTQSIVIPVDVPTDGELIFYGYCGANPEDAIAIDNIIVESSTYTTQAPGTNCIPLAAAVGTFTSPNYPSNYSNNANICWLITGADNVILEFNSFATEIGRDSLKIYLGRTTDSELYAELSGTSVPSTISKYTESMLIVFTSDSVNTNKGFSINYQVTRATTTTLPPTTTEFICETDGYYTTPYYVTAPPSFTCGGYFSDYSGTVQSPNYPYDYCNNLDCYYNIRVPSGYRVQLSFNTFDTESGVDVVRVYDGPTIGSPLLLSASGYSRPSTIYSTYDQMLVRFTTNNQNTRHSGWQAYYQYYY